MSTNPSAARKTFALVRGALVLVAFFAALTACSATGDTPEAPQNDPASVVQPASGEADENEADENEADENERDENERDENERDENERDENEDEGDEEEDDENEAEESE
jgi:hypothetical protein